MLTLLAIVAALTLDLLLGEPRRFHPLIGFGRLANIVERGCYGNSKGRGVVAVLLLLLPFAAISALTQFTPIAAVLDAVILYLAIGWRSLGEHTRPVGVALRDGDLAQARERVGRVVSRDTAPMESNDVAKAAVESVLENGNDAIFGAIFWFAIVGAPGAVVFRLANTLDAMWGYRNDRYRRFGWAAARFDDVLNFIPARLTALSYAIAGQTRNALRCWRAQARSWKSPNAGPVMAAGAGSLGLALGGPAWYRGKLETRPPLGAGRAPDANDIGRALRLIHRSLLIWLAVLAGGILLVERFLR
ncbi:MAG: cobalamin biosynthesis protein [Gammaproteobacteria bacterium]|nr:cobalamin biosynthesis protein [Gammaproteobacteria bacterium]